MELAVDAIGALIATYFVSRLFLWLLKSIDISIRIPVAHAGSWLFLTALVFLLESFSRTAGLIYIVPQLLWFLIDKLRFPDMSNSLRG